VRVWANQVTICWPRGKGSPRKCLFLPQNHTQLPLKVAPPSFWQFVWHSPTLTTWGSFLSRSSAIFLVLPLALRQFSPQEMTLWNVLMFITGFQMIIDMGFTPTFTRLVAFARSGAVSLSQVGAAHPPLGQPNWGLVASIYRVMKTVYLRLGVAYLVVLAIFGTYYVYPAATAQDRPAEAWGAWASILAVSFFSLRGNQTKAMIEGLGHVALLRRWEILTSLCGVLTTFLVFYFEGSILPLILASQLWVLINIWRNYRILASLPEVAGVASAQGPPDPGIFRQVWATAWRTGVGTLLTAGTYLLVNLQTTSYLSAQARHEEAAMFTTALRIMASILDFSVAPFYSKLPRLASLYSKGEMGIFMGIARQGMLRSYWAFVVPVMLAGMLGTAALTVLGSQVAFPDLKFWLLLGIASLLQRFGAAHLQLYSLSNNIVWHKAGAGLSVLFLLVWAVALPKIGTYAYPLAGVVAVLMFYGWYCACKSYRFFGLGFWSFEPSVSFLPFILLTTYTGLVFGGYNLQLAPQWAIGVWNTLSQWF
jgi:hypothetical protein